jgi:hypothetical protein
MAGGVDGFNSGKLKVPLESSLCVGEWGNECAARTIDMDGDIVARLLLEFVEDVRDLFYWLIVS